MLLFTTAAAVLLAAAFVVLILATHTARDAGREALRSQKAITAGEVLEKSVLNLDNGLRADIINGRRKSLRPYVVAKRDRPRERARGGAAGGGRGRRGGACWGPTRPSPPRWDRSPARSRTTSTCGPSRSSR